MRALAPSFAFPTRAQSGSAAWRAWCIALVHTVRVGLPTLARRCHAVLAWWLLAAGLPATAALTPEAATRVGGDMTEAGRIVTDLAHRLGDFVASCEKILAAVPVFGTDLWEALARVHANAGERSVGAALVIALGCLGTICLLVFAFRLATMRLRRWCLHNRIRARGATVLLLLDVGTWAVFAVGSYVAIQLFFGAQNHHALMFVAIVAGISRWWLLMLVLEVGLRPRVPQYRLLSMADHTAREVKLLLGAGTLVGIIGISVMPVLLRAGLPVPSGQVIVLLQGVVVALGCALALWRLRAPGTQGWSRARHIGYGVALASIPVTWLVWNVAVVSLDFSVYHSLVYSLRIALIAFLVHALLELSAEQHWWLKFAQHAINAAAVLAISITLVELWVVERLGLVPLTKWLPVRSSLITTAITLFVGFVAWRYLDLWTEQRLRAASPGLAPGVDEDVIPTPASRLTTSLPLVRVLVGVAIVISVAFLGLSQLGMDVTTLIAGAGVFGLALSFGSQALVRDIVSGVFFMSDDAFRVGEYIDTGRLKGTVERVTLRSVRLRHQNGQIHTIPFGQLNAITNFSRDWQTVKFNLRMARDTDIEKCRKVVKRVGQEMLQDAEFGKEFLLPLKLQGMAEITDSAMVVRLKFSVHPSNPSLVQREALKRLHRAFGEEGLEFAAGVITVRPSDIPTAVLGAAAAQAVLNPAPAPS